MTKLTLENAHGKYSIEVPQEDATLEQMIDDLFIPLLLAAGFHRDSIEQAMKE